jgi:hypothetical protein
VASDGETCPRGLRHMAGERNRWPAMIDAI